jgi:hypothetical protein
LFHYSIDGYGEHYLLFQGYGLGWRVKARDAAYRDQQFGHNLGFAMFFVIDHFKNKWP